MEKELKKNDMKEITGGVQLEESIETVDFNPILVEEVSLINTVDIGQCHCSASRALPSNL